MIKVENLVFGHGENPLYEAVSFIVGKGQKIGLVGPNGSGKTTLLKLISGKEELQKGKVEVIGSIGWVPQEVTHDPDLEASPTVKEYVDPEGVHQEHEILKLLSGLELQDLQMYDNPKKLSGGQKTKLALARALLSTPDILLLDEPTNFMDIEGKIWVMDFLANYPKTVILISHDLVLMDKAIDKVLSIEPQLKSIEEFKGNYTQYLRLKKEKEELLKREVLVRQKHIKRMEEGLKRMQRLTSKKGVRAKIRQKRRIEKAKIELPQLPPEIRKIKVNLPSPANVGELPVRCIDIFKSYTDNHVLTGVNFSVKRGERVALIGPNGAGKSTLLKIIMQRLEPDSGQLILNSGLRVGYYSQEFETFDLSKTVMDTFLEECKTGENYARSFLGRYMFLGEKVFQRVETLSGGEKTRLSIAMLTGKDHNLLILDEPTTYLDVVSQRVILEALKEYKGAMILVSHTQEFVKELVPERVLFLPEKRFTYWDDDFLSEVEYS